MEHSEHDRDGGGISDESAEEGGLLQAITGWLAQPEVVEARARLDGGLAELKDQLEEGGHALQQMWGEVADASGRFARELLEPDDDDGEFAPNPPPPATHLGAPPPPQPGACLLYTSPSPRDS